MKKDKRSVWQIVGEIYLNIFYSLLIGFFGISIYTHSDNKWVLFLGAFLILVASYGLIKGLGIIHRNFVYATRRKSEK